MIHDGAYIFVMSPSSKSRVQPGVRAASFDVLLHPHRSLGRRGFVILMSLLAALSLAVSLPFLLHGAWPVAAFSGLAVTVVYLCFKRNYRAGRAVETVRLDDAELVVSRTLPDGPTERWRFQPFWLRVAVERPLRPDSRLYLSSHGRRVAVGNFLTLQERLDLADALKAALSRWRAGLSPAGHPT